MPAGRPTLFKPEYVEKAQKLANLGLTDAEMAEWFEVSERTLHRWKIDSEEFCQALTIGKDHADERVKRGLYQKATGFDFTEQQAIKVKVSQYEERVEVVDVVRHQPPDTTAGIFWLKNRDKANWRDKHEVEHTGDFGDAETKELKEQLAKLAADPALRELLDGGGDKSDA